MIESPCITPNPPTETHSFDIPSDPYQVPKQLPAIVHTIPKHPPGPHSNTPPKLCTFDQPLDYDLTLSMAAAAMRSQLAASAVAASWRLGRWDLLQQYLPIAESASSELLDGADRWEVRLGRLLAAVASKDSTAMGVQV